MSDTPRTDAFYYDMRGEVPVLRDRSIHDDIEFARQFERELATVKAILVTVEDERNALLKSLESAEDHAFYQSGVDGR